MSLLQVRKAMRRSTDFVGIMQNLCSWGEVLWNEEFSCERLPRT